MTCKRGQDGIEPPRHRWIDNTNAHVTKSLFIQYTALFPQVIPSPNSSRTPVCITTTNVEMLRRDILYPHRRIRYTKVHICFPTLSSPFLKQWTREPQGPAVDKMIVERCLCAIVWILRRTPDTACSAKIRRRVGLRFKENTWIAVWTYLLHGVSQLKGPFPTSY